MKKKTTKDENANVWSARKIKPEKLICINFNLFSLCTILENGKRRQRRSRSEAVDSTADLGHLSLSLNILYDL
jgi:hypothetical protein